MVAFCFRAKSGTRSLSILAYKANAAPYQHIWQVETIGGCAPPHVDFADLRITIFAISSCIYKKEAPKGINQRGVIII